MIQSKKIQTASLNTHYLESGDSSKNLVVLVHGNVSSAVFFKPLMEKLGDTNHYVAPDMRGYGDSETKAVNAITGLNDFSTDLNNFIKAVNKENKPVHLLGWSLGGSVIMEAAMKESTTIQSLTLVSAMSPFGFGASMNTGLELKPTSKDFAGSGGGAVNPSFIDSIRTQDAKLPSTAPAGMQASPQNYARTTMNTLYFKAVNGQTLLQRGVIDQATEDAFTESMFQTKLGEDNYPGNSAATADWPGMAPGDKGVNNAISAKYCNISSFASKGLTLPILWIRGDSDLIVSDASFVDVNNLGKLGFIPGWPGDATNPPQPMIKQLRSVLDEYKKNGGLYNEVVFEDCGHSPLIEYPDKFKALFLDFIR
ncbi:alpha/beta hydrolase [Sphingobacteriaceae bacterium]|nr:alpha/beta hydrolase [Sphingobacteriaceae bacterium]